MSCQERYYRGIVPFLLPSIWKCWVHMRFLGGLKCRLGKNYPCKLFSDMSSMVGWPSLFNNCHWSGLPFLQLDLVLNNEILMANLTPRPSVYSSRNWKRVYRRNIRSLYTESDEQTLFHCWVWDRYIGWCWPVRLRARCASEICSLRV